MEKSGHENHWDLPRQIKGDFPFSKFYLYGESFNVIYTTVLEHVIIHT